MRTTQLWKSHCQISKNRATTEKSRKKSVNYHRWFLWYGAGLLPLNCLPPSLWFWSLLWWKSFLRWPWLWCCWKLPFALCGCGGPECQLVPWLPACGGIGNLFCWPYFSLNPIRAPWIFDWFNKLNWLTCPPGRKGRRFANVCSKGNRFAGPVGRRLPRSMVDPPGKRGGGKLGAPGKGGRTFGAAENVLPGRLL